MSLRKSFRFPYKGDIMQKEIARMKELAVILNDASRVYYQGKDEIMSNFEYDRLYDELCELEKNTGIVLSGSPTTKVGYEVVSELPKEQHGYDILSLDKTKDVSFLESWLGEHDGILSWKLDGLTVVVTYNNGVLEKAVTRGNGETGEVITQNARTFINFPLTVPFKERFVLRGEAIIRYDDFEKINEKIEDPDQKYKNPRNLCSGSVRQLDSSITAKRNVHFLVYSLIDSPVSFATRKEQLEWVRNQGFEVVGYSAVNADNIAKEVKAFSDAIPSNDFPSDGLVLTYDNIAYGDSLGRTAKFPRHSIAFKWADETAETVLREVEWSASRTGLINPVAIFDPVMLEGTTVSRASVHNISVLKELKLGIGDHILVYKANMIIPQIAENITKSNNIIIPCSCPVCGKDTAVNRDNNSEMLICTNSECPAKHIKSFTHFVSRDAMNIDGLSEATIEKFISEQIIKERIDIYHLSEYEKRIIELDGFGKRSYDNLINAVENSRKVRPENFIYSLGIPGIGLSNARMIMKHYKNDISAAINADYTELTEISGIGDVLAGEWVKFMSDAHNISFIKELLDEVDIIIPEEASDNNTLEGVTVVITGSLTMYQSRSILKSIIEQKGGKVTGSVTGNTDYLINNDVNSTSSKNRKAMELGVKIISEPDFVNLFLKEG